MLRNSEYAQRMESNRWSMQPPKPELKIVDPNATCTTKTATLIRNPQASENHLEYRLPESYPSNDETFMTRPNFGRVSQPVPPLPDLRHLQITSSNENTPSTTWTQVSDQTFGIRMIPNAPTHPNMPSTSHNILPRASTHIASADSTPRIAENNLFQPKFYQHPLVSGTIPPTTLFTPVDELPARLPVRKPTASILSNGSSLVSNVPASSVGVLNGTLPAKKDPGEKNKVKFSDTVQVAVVPVSGFRFSSF